MAQVCFPRQQLLEINFQQVVTVRSRLRLEGKPLNETFGHPNTNSRMESGSISNLATRTY
jgi:hypothetical protein